ncbi:MAG: hypothetical protein GF316_12770, partial [Candidatus Lokiarchaeota archaeon]|nr:hypothetical protein [Candidatus Lokiarchaeota archaeon]
MKKNTKIKSLFLLIFILAFPLFFSVFIGNDLFNDANNLEDFPKNELEEEELKINAPIGEDPWWNKSYQWRQLINITNPYDVDLTDYMTSIRINHTELIEMGKMQSDLGDVRIVENGQLRNYYFKTLYPSEDFAYIWFETDINASSTDYDTYLYYGNSEVGPSASYYKSDRSGTHWWGFEEGSGSTTEDGIGSIDGNLTNLDSNDWIDGKIEEYMLNFDAADNEYVQLDSDPIPNGPFTISLWFNADTTGGCIFDMTLDPIYLYIGLTSNGIEWYYEDSSDRDIQLSYTFPESPTGQWYHVVATGGFGGSLHELWINGDRKDFSTISLTNKGSLTNPRIATYTSTYASPNNYYDGDIDDLRIFDYRIDNADMNWLYTNYTLTTDVLDQQERAAQVEFTIRDVDERPIPNAEVSLINYSAPIPNQTISTVDTNTEGVATFNGIRFGEYNVTVKYSINNGTYTYEEVLYNSSNVENGTLNFQGLTFNQTINVDIWSIDFEVDDWDNDPMDYGYILVYDTPNSPLLANLTLASGTGLTTFRWLNSSDYYYEVYYRNKDYAQIDNLITQNTVIRESRLTSITENLNTSVTDRVGNTYSSKFEIYAENATTIFGTNKIISANISFIDIDEYLLNLEVYYLKSDETWSINPIFEKEYENFETSDSLILNILDNFEAYGLRFIVDFYNGSGGSINNGEFTIDYTQTTHEYTKANMSKLRMFTFDASEESQPIENMVVRVQNATSGNFIVNLTTDDNGEAKGINNEIPFWYFHDSYNFTISFYGTLKPFRVSQSDDFFDPSKIYQIEAFNYNLDNASILTFNVTLNIENYKSRFQNVSSTGNVIWTELMRFSVNYTIKEPGKTWRPIENPDYVKYSIKETGTSLILKSGNMNDVGNGNFTIQIDSSDFIADNSYILTVSGHKVGYIDPADEVFQFDINPKPTAISFYNYTSRKTLTTNKISQNYNELINISLSYNDTLESNLLEAESFTYSWDYGTGNAFLDPINNGYYYITINTSSAPNIGEYKIDVTAQLQNYTQKEESIFLQILERDTLLNGTDKLLQVTKKYYVLEENYIYFEYNDTENGRLSNLDEKSYTWYRLAENGSALSGPGNEGSGNLNTTGNNLLFLDFDTENREVSEYRIFIVFDKLNYKLRNSLVSLEIQERPTTSLINGSTDDPYVQEIFLGEAVNFTVSYNDTRTSSVITGSGNFNWSYTGDDSDQGTLIYDSTNEIYILDIGTVGMLNGSYTIKITLNKENYQEQTKTITLTITRIQADFQTRFTGVSTTPMNLTGNVFWGDEITIDFTFQNSSTGGTYWNDTTPDSLNLQFFDLSDTPLLVAPISLLSYDTGLGNYSFTFNTS